MKPLLILVLLCILISCKEPIPEPPKTVTPFGEFVDDFTFNVNHTSGYNFDHAEFRLWVPEKTDNLRAVLVLLNSHNGSGLGLTGTPAWQEYAAREKVALLGVYFISNGGSGIYTDAAEGSGGVMIRSLDSLATRHGFHDIKELPFLMRGYSAGGVFSHSFSMLMPERVVAFANIRGGSLRAFSTPDKETPGLMLMGENDDASRNNRIKSVVNQNRSAGGLWAFATEPKVDHFGSLNPADDLIRTFFSVALVKRTSSGTNSLNTISETTGWLGDNASQEIFSFDDFPGNKAEAAWLIDEEVGKAWQGFQEE